MKLTAKADIAIIFTLLALVIAFKAFAADDGGVLAVEHDGAKQTYELASLSGNEYIHIQTREGEVIIVADSSGAYVLSSPCKDKTCINRGKIGLPGECAVCMPCGVCIYITGGTEIDGITG